MRKNLFSGVAVVGLALSGCVSTTQEADRIRVVSDKADLSSCQFIAQITASSYWGGVAATGLAYNNALNDLRNQVAQRGGNRLYLVNSSNTIGGTNMIGDAYRCS